MKREALPVDVTDVAAAVIVRPDGRILLAERPTGKAYAGYWEFPGGKVEPGEAPATALVRELHEELGIEADTFHPWITRLYTYPHATVRLHFFRVTAWRGEPHGKENQHLSWENPAAVTVSPLLPANGPLLAALALPPVYGITAAGPGGATAFLPRLERALAAGLRLVQIREKDMAPEVFAAEAVRLAHAHGARVLVNGDAALAARCGADGVHLSAALLATLTARPELPLCGASCHSRTELERAAALGCDFALLSPVRATASHPDVLPLGWETFARLAAGLPLPVYALGGLAAGDLETAREHGAHGVALLRAAWPG